MDSYKFIHLYVFFQNPNKGKETFEFYLWRLNKGIGFIQPSYGDFHNYPNMEEITTFNWKMTPQQVIDLTTERYLNRLKEYDPDWGLNYYQANGSYWKGVK